MLVLWSSTLLAIGTGGVFSGPTVNSGSSAYWGPAALVRDRSPWSAHVELTGIIGEASYQRAPNAESGRTYEPTSFVVLAPDLGISIGAATPVPWLRVAGGTFTPYVIGSNWPDEGPQRYFVTDSLVLAYGAAAGFTAQPLPWLGLAVLGGPVYTVLELNSSFDFGGFANAKLPPGGELFEQEDPQLEGQLRVRAAGWSPMAVLGVYAEPLEMVRVSFGAVLPYRSQLAGSVRVEPPPSFDEALEGAELRPRGTFSLDYPLPLRFHGEVESDVAGVSLALLTSYTPGKPRRVIYPTVSEASHDFFEGRQISVKDTQDDWTVGLRGNYGLRADLDVGARIDFEPRSVPSEALTPINFDLGSIEAGAGARWRLSSALELSASLLYRQFFDTTVTNSVFNPRAPPESGLNLPSGNGDYDAWSLKLVIGVAWRGLEAEPELSPEGAPPTPEPPAERDVEPTSEQALARPSADARDGHAIRHGDRLQPQ